MDGLDLLVDFHKLAERQGPGSAEETQRAIELAGLRGMGPLSIADIGCGTGASTLVLAGQLDAHITAVDLFQEFLDVLEERAEAQGLAHKIDTLACPMGALPFGEQEYDVLWSEGAIYIMGFEEGVRSWRRFLKPGGILVVSEITWLTNARPAELQAHWDGEYPEIATASEKIAVLERNGYTPTGYFVLPEQCWTTNYYEPMRERMPDFLERHGQSEAVRTIAADEQREIDLYEKFKHCYSYGMYIALKTQDFA